jgi:2-polyprenyl-6-methoxyphenol hydroxylase-like FAD-dependent oxidoreductase
VALPRSEEEIMTYDIITVGGGLAGSALAIAMAQQGRRVLVIEGEAQFRDRVRGEQMATWGVAEAKELGLLDLLLSSCAHELPLWDIYFGAVQVQHRNMAETTPQQLPNLTFFHPEMQETLLREAASAGAAVRRDARVRGVEPGERPAVLVEHDGQQERIECRLVVGADGRSSMVRKWGGFEARRDSDRLQIGGILMEDSPFADDAAHVYMNPSAGLVSLIFPQGGKRARLYLVSRVADGPGHSGDKDLPGFLAGCESAGVDATALKSARFAGPLATFKGADSWVDHPYRDGVVLIGDAAGHSDPSWGQGLSLTLRDARLLRDNLLATDDWDATGDAYAAEQNRLFQMTRTVEDWFTQFFFDEGPEAEERRARVIPLIAQDATRIPDNLQGGPELVPLDGAARKRFFAED